MPINHQEYQESVTHELDVIRNRVRNLIGDAHWGEEGRYKEEILKKALRRYLPNNISVGSGFVTTIDGISKQLDIIIYNNHQPVLFSEGDFVITTPGNVLGVIEVKSRLNVTSLREAIEKYDEIANILPQGNENGRKIFHGLFSFEYDGNIDSQCIDNALRNSRGIINHISLGKSYFLRRWKQEEGDQLHSEVNAQSDFYNIYDILDLSFSYFISNIVDIVSGGLNDRYWFAFPIKNTKETHRLRTVYLNGNQA